MIVETVRRDAMLVIFGGLPGSGKSTIAGALAMRLNACYLCVDTIEQAIRASAPLTEGHDVGPAGYLAVYGLASENLRLGRKVIADSVNALDITRQAFRNVAAETGSRFIEVEVFCSDAATHRQRVEARASAALGANLPTWSEIQDRTFATWSPNLRLDTSTQSVEESVAQIMKLL